MKEYKLSARAPIILLGVPLAESENPFLALPTKKVTASFAVDECGEPGLEANGLPERLEARVKGFYSNLEEVARELCIRLESDIGRDLSPSGSYALLTTLLTYAIAKYYGERLDTWEVLELARYADPFDKPSGWSYVVDALRYSVLTGKPVVYRNDEEYARLEVERTVEPELREVVEAGSQALERESLGGDVYNSLVHLVGAMVLEGTVRVRDKESIESIIGTLGRLQSSIVAGVWRIQYPPPDCLIVPGIPREFEVYCW